MFRHSARQIWLALLFSLLISPFLYAGLFLANPARVLAASNSTINFQTKIVQKNTGLTPVNGSPSCINAGADTCDIRVSIYDSPSGGTLLWSETHSDVELGTTGGLINLSLNSVCNSWDSCGGGSGVNWGSDSTIYLQLELDTDGNGDFSGAEVFARKLISSVPFAYYADTAGSINGLTEENIVQLVPGATAQDVSSAATPLIYLNETDGANSPNLIQLMVGGTNAFVVENSGSGHFAGRVSVGTTTATAYLNAAAATTSQASLRLLSSGGVNPTTPNSGDLWWNGTNLNFRTGSSTIDLLAAGATNSFVQGGNAFGALAVLGTTDNNALAFNTNGVERMRLGANGTLGLGTTSATAQFQVNTGTSSGAVTMSATNGSTTFTTSASITLNAGDYIVPSAPNVLESREVTVGGTGTSFTVSPAFGADVTNRTFTIHRKAIMAQGARPMLSLNQVFSPFASQEWQLRVGGTEVGSSSFDVFNATNGQTALRIDSDGDVLLGTAINYGGGGNASRLFVYGGANGANVDVMGDGTVSDQAVIELQSSDYLTTTKSVFLQYYGVNGIGTTMGYNNQYLGVLSFAGDTAIIKTRDNIALRFGVNDIETARFETNGNFTLLNDLTVDGGDIITTQSTFNLLNTGATTLNFAGAASTLNVATGGAGTINIGASGTAASIINFGGGSADTGCTIDGSNGNLSCSGTISGNFTVADDSLDFDKFADALTLDAATDITLGALTLSTSGTGALNFASTGQVTFAGNVDATNGLDVTGANLTVGGTGVVATTSGALTTSGLVTVGNGLTVTTGATSLGGTLGVTGAATLSSTLGVTGATTLSSTLGVSGAAMFSSSLAVGGDITTSVTSINLLNATATTINFAGAASTLNIGPSGATATTINVAGGSANTGCTIDGSNGNLSCSGTISGTFNIADDSLDFDKFADALTLDASTNIALGALTLSTSGSGALNFASTGQVTFAGNVDATNGLDVTGAATVSSTLGVTGAATLSSTLGVTGATTLSSTLGVSGLATLSAGLTTTGTANINNNASTNTTNIGTGTTSGAISIGGGSNTLTIDSSTWDISAAGSASGFTTITSSGLITAGSLSTSTSVTAGNGLTVTAGATSLGGTLGVAGATTLSSTLGVTGATTLSNTLNVTGATTLSSSLAVGGDITTSASSVNLLNATATTINFAGAASTLNIGPGGTTATSINFAGGSANTGCTINGSNGNLTCSGVISGSSIAIPDDSLDFAQLADSMTLDAATNIALGSLTLSTSGTGALNFASTGQVTFAGNVDATNGLDVTGATTLSSTLGVTGATTLSSTLGVTGAATLSNTLNVTGATTLSSSLSVGGDITTTASTISLIPTNASTVNFASVASTINIGPGSNDTVLINFGGGSAATGCTMNGNNGSLNCSGLITAGNGLTVTTGAASLGGTLGVTGAATLSNTLNVTGATTLSSTLGVTGATTLSSTLGVNGLTTLSAGLTTTGAVNINNNASTNTTNIGTGTTTGAISIGGGSNTLTINSSTWDISAAGAATGFTTISSSGLISAGSLTTSTSITAGNGLTVTTGATSLGGALGVAGPTTLSSTLGVTGTTTLNGVLNAFGAATLSNTLGVTGATTLSSTLNVNGLSTLSAGLTASGSVFVNNFATSSPITIGTGAYTGAITFGASGASVAVASNSWNITSAGAVSGVTTISASSSITAGGIISTDGTFNGVTRLGNAANDYAPTNITWNTGQSTLVLNALDYSVIAFHDSANRVDFIRSGAGAITLGYDGGFGNAEIIVAGAFSMPTLGVSAGNRTVCTIAGALGTVSRNNGPCGTSSLRYKENIVNSTYGLDELLQLRPVFFQYKEEFDTDTSRKLGFIAEEVEAIIPEVAVYLEDGTIETLDYAKLSSLNVKAIQELNAKFEAGVGQIPGLQIQVTDLTNQVNNLAGQIATQGSELSIQAGQISTQSGLIAQLRADLDQIIADGSVTVEYQLPGTASFNDLTVASRLAVSGQLVLSDRNIGTATIAAGQTEIVVNLPQAFPNAPVVIASPVDTFVNYAVSNISNNSFKIIVSEPVTNNVNFNWFVSSR